MPHPIINQLFSPFHRISPQVRWALLIALVSSVIVFLMATLHLFNFLLIEDFVQARSIAYMRNFTGGDSFDKRIRIILIRENQQGEAPWGDIDKKHREFFTKVVTSMTKGKAKILAFDIAFEDASEFDNDFGKAIADAGESGVKVIVGVDNYTHGKTDPIIPSGLQGPSWGIILVGGSQGDDQPIGTLKLADLDIQSSGNPASLTVIPSLALKVVMEAGNPPLIPEFDQDQSNLVLYSGGPNREFLKSIPLERHRNLIIDQASQSELEYAKVDAESLMAEFNNQAALDKYKDAIVLVGYEKDESNKVLSGGTRLGVQLHATAVSNLLNNIFIYKLSPFKNYSLVLLMSLLGALPYTKIGGWANFKVPIPIPWTKLEIPIPLVLIILAVAYLIVAFVVYRKERVYLEIPYHLAALVISYAANWILIKIWFPPKPSQWESGL